MFVLFNWGLSPIFKLRLRQTPFSFHSLNFKLSGQLSQPEFLFYLDSIRVYHFIEPVPEPEKSLHPILSQILLQEIALMLGRDAQAYEVFYSFERADSSFYPDAVRVDKIKPEFSGFILFDKDIPI